jgi:hypothetical protein
VSVDARRLAQSQLLDFFYLRGYTLPESGGRAGTAKADSSMDTRVWLEVDARLQSWDAVVEHERTVRRWRRLVECCRLARRAREEREQDRSVA